MSSGRPRSAVHDGIPPRSEVVLTERLSAWATTQPDATAYVFREKSWTYGDAVSAALQVAGGLAALGVEAGDLVASWLPNGPAAVATWLGVNSAGAVVAPLHLAYRGDILEHVLNLSGAQVLVAHRQLLPRLAGLTLPHLRTVAVVGEGEESPVPPGLVLVDWWDVAEHSPLDRPVSREPWDEMAMLYTSGTTGPSKGVLCSYLHHYAYSSHLLPAEICELDRFYLCTPLSHVAGTAALVGMTIRGGALVVADAFSASRFWDDIRTFGVTTTFMISSMATSLSKQPPSHLDAHNPLQSAYMAPLLPDVGEFEARFGVSVYTGFGMTEVPTATHSGYSPRETRSCGRAVDPDCYELRLVDEHDVEVPDGTVGELILRHRYPWVLNSGYKDMPAATAEAWRNGWFHTGDYMIRAEDGEYFIVDRKKDVVRRRGENISSVEVEKALIQHPAVVEAAVIGVPSPDAADQEIMAVVIVHDGFDPAELIRFLVPRLPDFMVPRFVDVVTELPKTPSLKVAKYALRASGIRASTWDRVVAGIDVPRERIER
jgi:carnitine-CoA ligase